MTRQWHTLLTRVAVRVKLPKMTRTFDVHFLAKGKTVHEHVIPVCFQLTAPMFIKLVSRRNARTMRKAFGWQLFQICRISDLEKDTHSAVKQSHTCGRSRQGTLHMTHDLRDPRCTTDSRLSRLGVKYQTYSDGGGLSKVTDMPGSYCFQQSS